MTLSRFVDHDDDYRCTVEGELRANLRSHPRETHVGRAASLLLNLTTMSIVWLLCCYGSFRNCRHPHDCYLHHHHLQRDGPLRERRARGGRAHHQHSLHLRSHAGADGDCAHGCRVGPSLQRVIAAGHLAIHVDADYLWWEYDDALCFHRSKSARDDDARILAMIPEKVLVE